MPRIVGVDVPKEKTILVALTRIYGIGRVRSQQILGKLGIDLGLRAKDLTEDQVGQINTVIQREHLVEGDLRRECSQNIKRLMVVNCFRGIRHKRGLPVRGQRTHTNARTRKGPRKTVGVQRSK